MMKKNLAILLACVMLVGCGENSTTQSPDTETQVGDHTQENSQDKDEEMSGNPDSEEDDQNVSDSIPEQETINPEDYLYLAEDVTPEMMYADFWIDKQDNPDEILMTSTEIEAWNLLYEDECATNLMCYWDYDDKEEPSTISYADLKKAIEGSFYKPSGKVYDENGSLITESFWNARIKNQNLNAIKDENQIRYGITVARDDIRMLPYGGVVSSEAGSIRSCKLQESTILMNEPVLVLHESADEQWYYIFCSFTEGWVKAESIALCESKEQWLDAITFDNLLLITGDKVILEKDNYNKKTSEMVLYMGTKFELVKHDEYSVKTSERAPYDCYIIKVPVRAAEGMVEYEYALVPVSRDVHVGYLDCTAKNMLNQLFEANGDRYGWGGMHHARDCSQYAMEVYRCFGLVIGRNSSDQAVMPTTTYELEGKSLEERKEVFNSLEPGAILFFPGHIMLYLGEHNGEYYAISATGSFVPENSSTGEAVKVQSCLVNTLSVKRGSGITWLESITIIKTFL